ncbi:MAG: AAA family ATPase, partial [Candidatus Methanomethylophilaceae archaeon]
MRSIPIGVQSFIKVRESDLYYVDKTDLIDTILSDAGTEVFLYTRPRRFGKSLNLSMLDAYLNLEYAGNTWFDGLAISEKRPDDPSKNSIPVINLDLKDMDVRDYNGFLDRIRVKITDLYTHFDYLLESDRVPSTYADRFVRVRDGTCNDAELSSSIKHLSQMLEMHHGVKPIILIDEYDSPLNSNYGKDCHGDILLFLKDMLSAALKGNDSLGFAVITGVMQISKESIFSGLNNISVNNVFNTESDEMFGFTPEEVMKLCSDYSHPEKFDEAREWYDGYVFGNAEIYNPWSVLNYVKSRFRPSDYWAGTSGNSIIPTLLSMADKAVMDDLKVLGEGRSITRDIDDRISYADMTDVDGIYSVMVMSGYLKAVPSDDGYLLSIPNKEMYGVFGKMVMARFDSPVVRTLDRFCRSITRNDVDGISANLSSLLMEVMSSRVLDHEHSYQAFVA